MGDYTRVTVDGTTVNQRTLQMFREVERLTRLNLVVTQGSYNAGGVSASAGTHDGGGAIDIRMRDLTRDQRNYVVLIARKVGFAAWLRTPAQGKWPYHVHGIAIGDRELSRGARNQVTAYKNGLNGLASGAPDDGPRYYVNTTWEDYKVAHPEWQGLTVDQVEEIKTFVRGELKALEARLYAGPRYQALQGSLNELLQEFRSHDAEEDGRYTYYANKLAEILTESKEDNPEDVAPKA